MLRTIGRAYSVWRASERRESQRPPIRLDREELAFLPAAIEVTEKPCSPVARAMTALIIIVFLSVIAWSYFGTLDIVAVAQGIVIPSGRSKVIEARDIGSVQALHVNEGDFVTAGALLLELDPTETEVDEQQVERSLEEARVEHAVLSAVMQSLDGGEALRIPSIEVSDKRFLDYRLSLTEHELSEFRTRLATMESVHDQLASQLAGLEQEVTKHQQILPLAREEEQARLKMYNKGLGTKREWLAIKQRVIETERNLEIFRERRNELLARQRENEEQRANALATFRKDIAARRLESFERMERARLELADATAKAGRSRLYAPVSGYVTRLTTTTLGEVVRPAEPLMYIVPADSALEVEAFIENKDIGFVETGQLAEIKVESFPFTKYGLLEGTVSSVSAESVSMERGGLVFPARIALRSTRILVGDRWVRLTPGMNVTAEIKTGERRLIEYFLAPLLRYQQEGLRER